MNFRWKDIENKRWPGERLFLGELKWPVGSAHTKIDINDDGDPRKFECWVNLPGIRVAVSRHYRMSEAKAEVEKWVKKWFDQTLDGYHLVSNEEQ